jgi:hypothetical protein
MVKIIFFLKIKIVKNTPKEKKVDLPPPQKIKKTNFFKK